MPERLAVIREVRLGAEDHYGVALLFQAMITEGSGALQVLTLEKARPLLAKVDDVSRLNGRACWVDHDEGRGTIIFSRLAEM